jgi:hypothetical protein
MLLEVAFNREAFNREKLWQKILKRTATKLGFKVSLEIEDH